MGSSAAAWVSKAAPGCGGLSAAQPVGQVTLGQAEQGKVHWRRHLSRQHLSSVNKFFIQYYEMGDSYVLIWLVQGCVV
jgi:hypothetical protein